MEHLGVRREVERGGERWGHVGGAARVLATRIEEGHLGAWGGEERGGERAEHEASGGKTGNTEARSSLWSCRWCRRDTDYQNLGGASGSLWGRGREGGGCHASFGSLAGRERRGRGRAEMKRGVGVVGGVEEQQRGRGLGSKPVRT
jgi:hypothetical protein